MRRIKDIPDELQEQYLQRKITSEALAVLTGFHAVSLRRALKRLPAPMQQTKVTLRAMREKYRASIAHLPPSQIVELAHVSISTANRIRKKYANQRLEPQVTTQQQQPRAGETSGD